MSESAFHLGGSNANNNTSNQHNYYQLPLLPQPQSWPWTLPTLPDSPSGTQTTYPVPLPSQPALPYYSYPYPHNAHPRSDSTQPQHWQVSYPPLPQPHPATMESVNQDCAPPPSKRQKVQPSEPQVISLLSDDEDDSTTAAPAKKSAPERKVASSETKRSGLLLPTSHEDPVEKAAPSKRKRSGILLSNSHNDPARKAMSEDTKSSMRSAKARAKSTIKQRSSMPKAQDHSSPLTGGARRSFTPFSSSPPLRLNASDHTPEAYDSKGFKQPLTPPPSSFIEPEPMPILLSQHNGPETTLNAPGVASGDEPPLCPEQANLVQLIASGKNVFYTGSAGCGKSTVLKAFTKQLRALGKKVRVIAPTGRAALQVNGSTTWTYAGWTPDHHKRKLSELKEAAHGTFVYKRFKETDVLVIDEISMVENLHLERLNAVMKEARHDPKRSVQPAFGGVQVIVTGDFCQLPPVKPFQHCIQCGYGLVERNSAAGKVHVCKRHGEWRDEDKWAFRSKAWEECNFVHVHLNTIHRQSDETFIRILQKCRIGRELSPADTDLLMDHKCMVHHATRLFATREEVANVNRREFERLKTMNHTYWCLDTFHWQREAHPHLGWKGMRKQPGGAQSEGPLISLGDHRFDECVQLKKGMLVVLLVNLDLQAGLCNGSQGLICGFERNDPKKLPQAKNGKNIDPSSNSSRPVIYGDRAEMKERQIRRFIEDPGARYKTWPTVRFHNGQVRTIYADCSVTELGDERPYSLLARTQIPLAPAWAMTIHKSQSLTLDRVIVNLSRAFEEGQVYVALSRATGLHGLKIEGDSRGLLAGLGGNPEVQRFLRDKFGALDGVLTPGS